MIMIGSARHDERNKYSGGAKGDQLQVDARDLKGEVSMQDFYLHNKGWYILRAKDDFIGSELAKAMRTACNNSNIGYSQSDRYDIIKKGIRTKQKANCDCSSLVRACVIAATGGKDPGDFNTANEIQILTRTGLFYKPIKYTKDTELYNGDILVTCSKGHTVIVCGHARKRKG